MSTTTEIIRATIDERRVQLQLTEAAITKVQALIQEGKEKFQRTQDSLKLELDNLRKSKLDHEETLNEFQALLDYAQTQGY